MKKTKEDHVYSGMVYKSDASRIFAFFCYNQRRMNNPSMVQLHNLIESINPEDKGISFSEVLDSTPLFRKSGEIEPTSIYFVKQQYEETLLDWKFANLTVQEMKEKVKF